MQEWRDEEKNRQAFEEKGCEKGLDGSKKARKREDLASNRLNCQRHL